MINISNKSECTGCSACYSVCSKNAISMVTDKEGFKYPEVDESLCIDCGLCDRVCPIGRRDNQDISFDIPIAYAAHYKNDEKIWYDSASGGAFTAITDYIFKHNGRVYGAALNDKLVVEHGYADNKKEALKFRDSKYVQSDIKDCFKHIKRDLKDGKIVLFSGTPCQVAGLKDYLRKPYDNLLTVDLICHCVPSPRVFEDYKNYIETKYDKKIIHICFKDKTLGWDKFQTPRIYFDDGSNIFNIDDSKLWALIFYSHLAVRPSCHTCRFANLNREGDLTIGDFWGVEKQHPEYLVPNGASLVLINSDKGKEAFKEISDNLVCSLSDAVQALPDTLLYVTKPHSKRSEFWNDYEKMSFKSVTNRYLDLGKKNEYKRKLKRVLRLPFRLIKNIMK